MRRSCILLMVFAVFIASGACAQTIEFSGCGELNVSGATYMLNSSILDSDLPVCLNITADDIVLDCQGYRVDGLDTVDTYGVYVKRDVMESSNVTIRNCQVSDWFYGVFVQNSSNDTFENNTVFSNSRYGFYFDSCSENNLTGNNASSNLWYGFSLISVTASNLTGNIAQENLFYDLYVAGSQSSCCDNVIEGMTGSGGRPIGFFNSSVTLEDSSYSEIILCDADSSELDNISVAGSDSLGNNGVYLLYTDSSNLSDIVSNNNLNGFKLEYSSGNSFSGADGGSNAYDGVFMYSSSGNIFTEGNFSENLRSGIYLFSSGNPDNVFYNNLLNNTLNVGFYALIFENTWNTANSRGVRVFSEGTRIGGNYYASPGGNGYSELCNDSNFDGFCDLDYDLSGDGNNVDYLPLSDEYVLDPFSPAIEFAVPTESNASYLSHNWAEVNVTIDESALDSLILSWQNTSSIFYDSSLILALNFENNPYLEENLTHAVDISPYGNDATLVGAQYSEGKFGGCLQLDGLGYASSSDNITSYVQEGLTIEAWIKTDSLAHASLVGVWDETFDERSFDLEIVNGKWRFATSPDGMWNAGNSVYGNPVSAGVWTYVAATYGLQYNTIYVNNDFVNSSLRASDGINDVAVPLRVGYSPEVFGVTDVYFNGSIDNIRVYNRALDAEEILLHYQSEIVRYNETRLFFYANISGPSEAFNNFSIWVNDTSGRSASTSEWVNFIDAIPPLVDALDPTPENLSSMVQSSVYLNISASDNNGAVSVFVDKNNSLDAYWSFENMYFGSTAVDESGNANTATFKYFNGDQAIPGFSSGNVQAYPGVYGQSALFSDHSNYFYVGDSSSLDVIGELTLEAWVKAQPTTRMSGGRVASYKKISSIGPVLIDEGNYDGSAVADLGDIDGDGVSDLFIGSRLMSWYSESSQGGAWVLRLNADGSIKAKQRINDYEGNFTGGIGTGDAFGCSAATIGDLDGDNVTEVAVGAYCHNNGEYCQGAVWILFMKTDGTLKAQQEISDGAGNLTTSLMSYSYFGSSITSMGDINGDGVQDIAVGARGFDDDGESSKGAVFILCLNADGTIKHEIKLNTSDGLGGTLDQYDGFGSSISNVGDFNGDGFDDLAVGGYGEMWLFLLGANGTVNDYSYIRESFCYSGITPLGDLDSDGVTDIACSYGYSGEGGSSRGGVKILFMNPDSTIKSTQVISDLQGNFYGTLDDSDYFGSGISNFGDFNGDGITDLVVGAPGDDDGTGYDRGAVWILYMDDMENEIISKGDAYALTLNSNSSTLTYRVNTNTISTPVENITDWHHIVASYDGSTQRIYIDSELKTSGSYSSPINANTNPVSLGVFGGYSSLQLDEVKVWSRKLEEPEINSSFDAFSDPFELNYTGLSDGNYSFTVYANDIAGNIERLLLQYVLDTQIPYVTLEYPYDNTTVTPGTYLNLTIRDATTYIDSTQWSIDGGITNSTEFCFDYDINTTLWGEGSYDVDVWANDAVDNLNHRSYSFTLDGTSPVLNLSPIFRSNGTYITYNSTSINITTSDSSNTTTILDWNQSLLGYWRFNEDSGTTAYDSASYGKNCNVSVENSLRTWDQGHFGRGLHFDGNDDYVDCGGAGFFNMTAEVTVEAWVRSESEGGIIVKDRMTSSEASEFCASTGYSQPYHYLTRVAFNTFNVNSGSDGYSDNTHISTDVVAGNTYTLSVSVSPYVGHYIIAWIDFDNNHVFNDADEKFVVYLNTHGTGYSKSITIPTDSVSGPVRMRVVTQYGSAPGPCGSTYSGETEDYTVNILPHDNVPFRLSTVDGGKFEIVDSGTPIEVTYSGSVNDGNWHHLAGTYNGSEMRLYVDGELEASGTSFSGPLPLNDKKVYVGGILNYPFEGIIDEVRIWNRSLPENEIKASYNSGLCQIQLNLTELPEAAYNYQVFSQDLAGNTNDTGLRVLAVDNTSPVTSASALKPDSTVYSFGNIATSDYVNVTLGCTDASSGCNVTYYCVDTLNSCTPDLIYQSPLHVTDRGTQYVRFYSKDLSGNTDPVQNRTVLLTGPLFGVESIYPDNGTLTIDPLQSFNFTVRGTETFYPCDLLIDETGFGQEYFSMNNTVVQITPNASIPEGGHTWRVNCTIANLTNSTEIRNITLDSIAPQTTVSGVKSNGSAYGFGSWATGDYVNVSLNCSDAVSGCDGTFYCIDSLNNCTPDTLYTGTLQFTGRGMFHLRFRSNDTAGNLAGIENRSIMLTWPYFSLSGPDPANNSFRNDPTPSFGFIVNGSESQYNCTLLVDNVARGYDLSVSNGTLTYIVSNTSLTEGNHSWKISCSFGNVSNISVENVLNLDFTFPLLNLTGPENNSFVNRTYVCINWSLYEENMGDVILYWNGTLVPGGLSGYNVTGLDDGVYSYHVAVNDSAGNTNTTPENTLIVDLVAPRVSFTYPTPENGSVRNMNSTLLSWSIQEDYLSSVTLNWNGTSILVNGTSYNMTGLQEGVYSYFVAVNDSAGNMNVSETRILTIDRTAPIINFIEPTPSHASALNRNWVYLNWTVDESNLDHIMLVWNGSSIDCSVTYYNLSGLADGMYSYYVWVNDTGGNNYSSEVRNVSVDTTVPWVMISSPQNTVYSTSNVELQTSIADSTQLTCWYSLNSWVTNTSFDCSRATLSASVGDNLLLVAAQDAAGNLNASENITFTVNLLSGRDHMSLSVDSGSVGEEVEVLVRSESGRPLDDVYLSIYFEDELVETLSTDNDGMSYFIPDAAGDYLIIAERSGYYAEEKEFSVTAAESCIDGIRNQDETDIDCGGSICSACGEELLCSADSDCESSWCLNGVCTVSTCNDGIIGPGEEDIDCGGFCPACESCSDGLLNQNESDIDCGGVCGGCSEGSSCNVDLDCISEWCYEGVCGIPSCSDGVLNQGETGVDCGGSACGPCDDGLFCKVDADCITGNCVDGLCVGISCFDGIQNAGETDVDCGGNCSSCEDGKSCMVDIDCVSGWCYRLVCSTPTCSDGALNQNESDVDCGGSCSPCSDDKGCRIDEDCVGGNCYLGICITESCTDGIMNQDEAGIDCGGSCDPCGLDGGCGVDSDCVSTWCLNGTCLLPTCFDGYQNGGEEGVDCGASCVPCHCMNNLLDEGEEGIDCGNECPPCSCSNHFLDDGESDMDCGGLCAPCSDGRTCAVDRDCIGTWCLEGLCATSSCSDGRRGPGEDDIDCGGSCVPCHCFNGELDSGEAGIDCGEDCPSCRRVRFTVNDSGQGSNGDIPVIYSVSSLCFNGMVDKGETDVDCGGRCLPCDVGENCVCNLDCLSGFCYAGSCSISSCKDGLLGPDEEKIDCGGVCRLDCPWIKVDNKYPVGAQVSVVVLNPLANLSLRIESPSGKIEVYNMSRQGLSTYSQVSYSLVEEGKYVFEIPGYERRMVWGEKKVSIPLVGSIPEEVRSFFIPLVLLGVLIVFASRIRYKAVVDEAALRSLDSEDMFRGGILSGFKRVYAVSGIPRDVCGVVCVELSDSELEAADTIMEEHSVDPETAYSLVLCRRLRAKKFITGKDMSEMPGKTFEGTRIISVEHEAKRRGLI